jgi:hypothetical protein
MYYSLEVKGGLRSLPNQTPLAQYTVRSPENKGRKSLCYDPKTGVPIRLCVAACSTARCITLNARQALRLFPDSVTRRFHLGSDIRGLCLRRVAFDFP